MRTNDRTTYFNQEAFVAVTKWLRDSGHETFSPAEQDCKRHNGVDILKSNPNGDAEKLAKDYGFSLRHALRDDLWLDCGERGMPLPFTSLGKIQRVCCRTPLSRRVGA